ncbi:hypothetical protein Rhe02_09860 [Rhizocola hellebori]|uniref:Uncharacterized protein n=1 Tax=Rhizocola hellebori TaxID=1392758 RepID=A0A8J3VCU8_9ACTN|nr:hypothetical protein [Rhizocola hellebori]GIH02919.1 hypothetical protein Rhe02_09860 [Rhizocola hellebori]
MKIDADQVGLLGGAAIAGVIAISASDGPYEPFETVIGIVLAVLVAAGFRPRYAKSPREQFFNSVPPAMVGGLLAALIVAFPFQQWIYPRKPNPDPAELIVLSWWLAAVWLVVTAALAKRLASKAARASGRSPTA